ncbi:hypothetical protein PTKIN_Ptkin12aG0171100 [Pterospermum kingtungense]
MEEVPDNETKHGSELVNDDEKVQEKKDDGLREPNATFLTDLNLLIVALSLSSICTEDGLDLADTQEKDIKGHEANKGNACIPRLHAKKGGSNDIKIMRRQTQKTQSQSRDFR